MNWPDWSILVGNGKSSHVDAVSNIETVCEAADLPHRRIGLKLILVWMRPTAVVRQTGSVCVPVARDEEQEVWQVDRGPSRDSRVE